MENASKALIIAGAILISILLISIGVMIITSAGGIIGRGQTSMDAQAIEIFNSQFTNYSGTQRGSTVKTLLQTVNASNATHDENVDVENSTTSVAGTTISEIMANLKPTTRYLVVLDTDADTGLVNKITIKDITTSTP